jgi:hypothetical protein
MEVVCKSRNQGRQYDCVCGLHGQIAKSHRKYCSLAKVSDASRPLVRAIFQVTPSHVCSSSTEGFAHYPEGYGTVWQNSGFQAGTWQESRAHAPVRNKQKNCPLRDLLSKYTNMDNGQREFGGGCQKESTSLSNTRLWYDKPVNDADRDVGGKDLALMHKKRSNRANCCPTIRSVRTTKIRRTRWS